MGVTGFQHNFIYKTHSGPDLAGGQWLPTPVQNLYLCISPILVLSEVQNMFIKLIIVIVSWAYTCQNLLNVYFNHCIINVKFIIHQLYLNKMYAKHTVRFIYSLTIIFLLM